MPTYTTTYSLGKPVVGADEDAWGDTLNASLDSIDDILDGTTPVTGIDINSGTLDGVTIGGTTAGAGTFTTLTANTSITGTLATAAQPNVTSLGTLTGLTVSASASLAGASTTADITFGDNDKAIFGAGSDLQIYHNGTNSIIVDEGQGNLVLKTNGVAITIQDTNNDVLGSFNGTLGAVYLNHVNGGVSTTRFATTSTGVDITGTLTSDGLTVDGAAIADDFKAISNTPTLQLLSPNSSNGYQLLANVSDAVDGGISIRDVSESNAIRLNIANNGDISFYEDTGTTAKFFWDASAESLGIGTSSPQDPLHVAGDVRIDNAGYIVSEDNAGGGIRMLGINGSNVAYVGPIDSGPTGTIYNASSSSVAATFYTAGSERMRIDSSGNLLVGKTSADFGATAGMEMQSNNTLYVARSGGSPLTLNRLSSDGDIALFRKDDTTVGSIGSSNSSSLVYIAGSNSGSGLGFSSTTANIFPARPSGAVDNTLDLGRSDFRFDDIYATNGTIQTSDQNEKQDIAELTEAEQRVAVAAKGLLRKFRWRDAVEEKGDEARTHFGIIAQDLQAAFEAEGLDAGDYAMFIHSTWTDEETGEERSRMGVRYSELLAFIIAAI